MRPLRLILTIAISSISSQPARSGEPVSFERDVMAVLSRGGCNMGACHGNLNGRGGLKLTLRGEDAAADLSTLTRDTFGRRVDLLRPDDSLILQKATCQVPHEGGIRFGRNSQEYAIVRAWLATGGRADPVGQAPLVKLDVSPSQRIVVDPEDRFTIKVSARFADGTSRDVTSLATFDFTALGVAHITSSGEVIREQVGETVLLVRYLTQMAPVRVVFLPDRPRVDLKHEPVNNEIDHFVMNQLQEMRLHPAEVAPDHIFLRRAYLDTLGILPTANEARAFLADNRPDKREQLIDALLARPEFAEYWAQKWSDLLRNEEKSLDRKGVAVFYRWITAQIAADRPLNEFARDILGGRGSTYANPPANFWRAVRDPLQRAESVAQVFLGVRVACARCHNHPFDRWTMDDYYGFAAFFARIDYRILENRRGDDLDKHEFVGEQIVWQKREGETISGRTKAPAAPRFLGSATPRFAADADRLSALADWVAAPDNTFFARAQVNRIWLHLMGRGLVDPNDDFRATNPPTNPALLDWLARDFTANGFHLKSTIRRIMTSRVYQFTASTRDKTMMGDDLHHSHAFVSPLEAEQLLDAMAQVVDVPVRFGRYPMGMRANQLPAPSQPTRRGTDGMGEQFLKVFGKPERLLTCECERNDDPGLLQAFQMITGGLQNQLIREPNNRIGKLLASGTSNEEMLDELYLAALCRTPSSLERTRLLDYAVAAKDRRAAWEDILWGILNSKEFLLRR